MFQCDIDVYDYFDKIQNCFGDGFQGIFFLVIFFDWGDYVSSCFKLLVFQFLYYDGLRVELIFKLFVIEDFNRGKVVKIGRNSI